jgi:hypothetical protein
VSAISSAAKYVPPIAVAVVPFDPWWALLIPSGLIVGMLARAGRMVGENRASDEIWRDLVVSLLIGGANAVLAALLIHSFGLDYLKGLAVSVLCGFGGVKSIESAARWAQRHVREDLGEARQEVQRERSLDALQREADLKRLAKRLDDKIEEGKAP